MTTHPSKQAHDPFYETAAEAVSTLRQYAVRVATDVLRPKQMTHRGWKPKRPIDQARLDQKLNNVCTCLELLTVQGNYSWERERALEQARKELGI